MDRGSRGRRGRGSGIMRTSGSDRDRAFMGTDVWPLESPSPSARSTPTSTPSQRGRANGSHGADVYAPRATPKSERPAKTSGNPNMTGSNGSTHNNQNMQHAFTFSTPANTRGPALRKRARTFDFGLDGAADDETEVKGGHSLRKRMRVDYAQMHDDDALYETAVQDAASAVKVPSAAVPRGRKRRVDDDSDDFAGSSSAPKKRSRLEKRTESPAASRRKQQRSRKSSTSTQSQPHVDQPSDTELKDTIEVGVTLSDQDFDEPRTFNQFSDSASITSRESGEEALSLPRASPSEAAQERRDTRDAAEPAAEHLVEQHIQHGVAGTTESLAASEAYSLSSSPVNETGNPDLRGSSMSFDIKQEESQVAAETPSTESHIKHEASDSFVTSLTSSMKETQHDVTDTASHATEQAPEEPLDVAQTDLTNPTATTEEQDTVEDEQVPTPKGIASQITEAVATDEHLRNAPSSDVDAENIVSEKNETEHDATSPSNEAEAKKARREEPGSISKAKAISQPSESESKNTTVPATSSASTKAPGRQDVTNHLSSPAAPTSTASGSQYHRRRKTAANKSKDSLKLFGRGPKAEQFPEGKDYSYLSPYLSETVLLPEMAEASGVATPVPAASNGTDDPVPEDDKLGDDNAVDEEDAIEASQERREVTNGDDVDDQEEPAAADQAEEDVAPAVATSAPASVAASERNTPVLAAKNTAGENFQAAKTRKKYPYPKVRDPSEIMKVIENYKDMPTPDLYNALSAINSVMVQWQHDYNELRKITDDEDNAVRRRAHDAAYEARVAKDMTRQSGANITLERDFQVRGVRVKEPTYQNEKHYFRQQDRLMAEVYNFEYDPRDSMIGKQDPLLQREGLQNTRLRNRPKQTQKAAEAADDPATIVTGKRTRKPRILDDGSKEPSRAASPAELAKKPLQRRRRGRMAGEALRAESEVPVETNGASNGSLEASQDGPQKKPRGRRSAKAAQEAAAAQALAGDDQETEPEPEDARPETYEPEQPKTRKRGRGGRRPAVSRGAKKDDDFVEPPPPAKRQRTKATAPGVEIPSASFYNNHPSPADTIATPTEEERPTTSSSNGTTQTVESNYSFRERKRKNYNELVSFGDAAPGPKPKRTRRAKAETPVPVPVIPPASSYSSVDAPAGPGATAAPAHSSSPGPSKPRIRLHNGGGGGSSSASNNRSGTPGGPLAALAPAPVPIPRLASSRGSSVAPSKAPSRKATPAPSAASGSVPPDDAPAKDYAQMTKSEKMSNSMKARWANGSMARAVEKRKATLARKKQQQQEQQQAQQAEQQQQAQQLLLQASAAAGAAGPPASGGDAGGGAGAAPPPILPAAAVPIAAAPLPPAAASSRRG